MRINLFNELLQKAHGVVRKKVQEAKVSRLLPILPGDQGKKVEEARRILEKLESKSETGWNAIYRAFPCDRR